MPINSIEGRQVLSRHREERQKKQLTEEMENRRKKMNKTKVTKRCSLYF